MTCCKHCEDAGDLFNQRTARRDLRHYRSRGPSATTRLLLDALLAQRRQDATVLDIGGGVGAISHTLLEAGFSQAVQVDASPSYLASSEEEASRRGLRDRISYQFGDFVELAPRIDPADVVTLDRVICCYADVERLVTASVGKARHLYGLVYPRERLTVRIGSSLGNLWFRLRRSAFRTYVHPSEQVEQIIYSFGFRRTTLAYSYLWQIVTYARA